jgi:hypothetical protein
VDNLKDTGDGTIPSPATDLVASTFAIQNVANALVMELASIQGTFIWFHEQIATSLDRMTEVLVKEQSVAQRDRFASFRLLERIAEALERSSPRQAGVVPTEGLVAEGTEVVPVVIAEVEWAWTPLFLRDSDSTDMLFALEASKDSKEDSGHGNGNRNEGSRSRNEESRSGNKGSGSGHKGSRSKNGSFGAMDGDVMVNWVPVLFPFYHFFLFSPLVCFFFLLYQSRTLSLLWEYHIFVCPLFPG